jgi:hypothetical protein
MQSFFWRLQQFISGQELEPRVSSFACFFSFAKHKTKQNSSSVSQNFACFANQNISRNFVFFRFVNSKISFRFAKFHLDSLRFTTFHLVSYRFAKFHLVLFRFADIQTVSFHKVNILIRFLIRNFLIQ